MAMDTLVGAEFSEMHGEVLSHLDTNIAAPAGLCIGLLPNTFLLSVLFSTLAEQLVRDADELSGSDAFLGCRAVGQDCRRSAHMTEPNALENLPEQGRQV